MKSFVLGISAFMLTLLTIISIFVYQKPDFFITSPPGFSEIDDTTVSAPGGPAADALRPVDYEDSTSYSLQNDELHLTYNQGEDWVNMNGTISISSERLLSF